MWISDHFGSCDKIEQADRKWRQHSASAGTVAVKCVMPAYAPPPLETWNLDVLTSHSGAVLSFGTACGEMALAGCGHCSAEGARTRSSALTWQPGEYLMLLVICCSLNLVRSLL